jgi:hypothetical protein
MDRLARGLPEAIGDLVDRRGSIYVRRRMTSMADSRCGLDAIRKHHSEICVLLANAERSQLGTPDDQWVLRFLAAHMVAEENIVYPALLRYDETGRMHLAIDEHFRLKRILVLLAHRRVVPQDIPAAMRVLRLELLCHAQQDEHQLFAAGTAALDDHARNTLGHSYTGRFQHLVSFEQIEDILDAARVRTAT